MRYVVTLFKKQAGQRDWDAGYSPEWVDKFARNVRKWSPNAEVAVVTDWPEDSFKEKVEVYEMVLEFRNWASLMEMFRPEIVKNKAILCGLDIVFVGPLKTIEDNVSGCVFPIDPYDKGSLCNAVVGVDVEAATNIWDKWYSDPDKADKKNYYGNQLSEMKWLRQNITPTAWWNKTNPEEIRSYKVEGMSEDAKIIYFHGNPKQTQIDDQFVKENWV